MIKIEETKITISMTLSEAEELRHDLASMPATELNNKYKRLSGLWAALDRLRGSES